MTQVSQNKFETANKNDMSVLTVLFFLKEVLTVLLFFFFSIFLPYIFFREPNLALMIDQMGL